MKIPFFPTTLAHGAHPHSAARLLKEKAETRKRSLLGAMHTQPRTGCIDPHGCLPDAMQPLFFFLYSLSKAMLLRACQDVLVSLKASLTDTQKILGNMWFCYF